MTENEKEPEKREYKQEMDGPEHDWYVRISASSEADARELSRKLYSQYGDENRDIAVLKVED